MSRKASKHLRASFHRENHSSEPEEKRMQVKFQRPVKAGGMWYEVGQEASLPSNVAESLIACGLAVKVSCPEAFSKKEGK